MSAEQLRAQRDTKIADMAQAQATYEQQQTELDSAQQLLAQRLASCERFKQEVSDADNQWRQLLQANGGQVTAEVTALREKTRDSQEMLSELQAMVTKDRPTVDLVKAKTALARHHYLHMLAAARSAHTEHALEAAVDALMALPATEGFIAGLTGQVNGVEADMTGSAQASTREAESRAVAILERLLKRVTPTLVATAPSLPVGMATAVQPRPDEIVSGERVSRLAMRVREAEAAVAATGL